MLTSTSIRPRALLAVLATALVALLVGTSAASAATISCSGHTEKAEAEVEGDFALGYQFGCSDKIIGYSVIFNQEVQGFAAEIPVLDTTGSATNELFSCEGDIPSFGVGCFGTYAAGGRNIKGTVTLDRDACAEPRYSAWLMVVTGAKGQQGGPFELGRPQGCEKSSLLRGLLAWITMLRDEAKSARKR
jgi:hypothetical protein